MILTSKYVVSAMIAAAALGVLGPVAAQQDETADTQQSGETAPDEDPANENLANELTKRHTLRQEFTIKRIVDGEVVETTERSVAIDGSRPSLPTEAGQSIEAQLKESFDQELLTRTEALSEAKLDFALGDIDRDGLLSKQEFTRLIDLLQQAGGEETGRETSGGSDTEWRSFVDELDDPATPISFEDFAGSEDALLDEKQFTLGFLHQFDETDLDGDGLLAAEELARFRNKFGA